jgi:uncharacterized protein (DUF2267 family)
MSATGLEIFDSTIQTTNIWLNDVMRELGWTERHKAFHALRSVLQTLRDRLSVTEAAQLSAQLPLLIRGVFFEGWHPADKPLRERHWDQFVAHVSESFALDTDVDPTEITRVVLRVLCRHVAEGEAESLRRVLPAQIRELMPA